MSYAVVLGASTGVGAAVAKRLYTDGMNVIGFHRGRHQDEANGVFYSLSLQSAFYVADAGCDEEHVDAALRRLAGRQVSVFVHSLAGAAVGSSLDLSPAQIERTMNVMAHSFLYWCRGLFRRQLLAPNAALIALSNPCGDFYLRGSGVIGAAKAALEAYVRMLAAELGPHGHRVNAIRFSTVLTPALCKVLSLEAQVRLKDLHQSIMPGCRMQTPKDIAGVVSRLVQDPVTNGAVLDHTGGSPMMLMDHAFNGRR